MTTISRTHNPNIHLNDLETASIEQLKPVISETSLLASMMVEQPIIQAAITSRETPDGTKSKSEFLDSICKKCSTNFGIKHLAYSISKNDRITPYFSLHIKRPSTIPNIWLAKNKLTFEAIISFNNTLQQPCHPMLLPIYSKVPITYSKCTYIVLVSFCQKFTI